MRTATQEIRKLNRPDAKTIPIIALTANAFEEDVKECLEVGMNAHLSKPVDIDLLKKDAGGNRIEARLLTGQPPRGTGRRHAVYARQYTERNGRCFYARRCVRLEKRVRRGHPLY